MSNSNKWKDFYSANSQEVIENALKYHFQSLVNFTSNDSFIKVKNDIIESTITTNLVDKFGNTILEEEILLSEKSSLIIGAPGVGKTVLVKRLISLLISSIGEYNYDIPILLRGHEITNNSITHSLNEVLNIHNEIEENELFDTLANNKTIIFIDGIDEVYSAEIEPILNQIETLILNQKNIKIVLTSRVATISREIRGMNSYQIETPSSNEILNFLKSFDLGSEFIAKFNQSSYKELATSPLILSQLIRFYEANGELPHNRNALYQHIIQLYLKDWDAMRMVRRASKFQTFHNEKKFEFLTVLAYKATIEYSSYFFEKQKLINIIESFIDDFNLSASDIDEIVVFLVESTGLLIEDGLNIYSFLHKSIQEFLAANYLIRLPYLPIEHFKEHPEIYAIATTLSSQPKLVKDYISENIGIESKSSFHQYELRLNEEINENWL